LQGNGVGVTSLKYGEIYDMDFVANFMENTRMKKFRKSVNKCQTYEGMYNGTVLLRHGVRNTYNIFMFTQQCNWPIATQATVRSKPGRGTQIP